MHFLSPNVKVDDTPSARTKILEAIFSIFITFDLYGLKQIVILTQGVSSNSKFCFLPRRGRHFYVLPALGGDRFFAIVLTP